MSEFKEVESSSWTDFVTHITKHIEAAEIDGDPLYFRGQADASWSLETTLERGGLRNGRAIDYVDMALRYLPEIESVTGRKWDVPTWHDWIEADSSRASNSDPQTWPWFEFFVYLRQFGFPSPLLDWTRSPWIATHFALSGGSRSAKVAIYAYQRPIALMDAGPGIVSLHTTVRSGDRRHFVQQACYTTATYFDKLNRVLRFVPHDGPLAFDEERPRSGYLTKFVLPSAYLPQARRWLEKCGINDFMLFGTEDSLIRTIGRRIIELD